MALPMAPRLGWSPPGAGSHTPRCCRRCTHPPLALASPRSAWIAEENRHGDLLNKFLWLTGRVDLRSVEKTIQRLISSGMNPQTENNPYLAFTFTSFQVRLPPPPRRCPRLLGGLPALLCPAPACSYLLRPYPAPHMHLGAASGWLPLTPRTHLTRPALPHLTARRSARPSCRTAAPLASPKSTETRSWPSCAA